MLRPDPEIVNRLERLELEARQIVEGMLAGRHRSPRHGFAVEFAQHRPYVPGDDLKHIDWKVYGRTERFHLKQYEQETNLVAWLLVDASESMAFRWQHRSKQETASLAAAALAYLVLGQSDSVGLMTLRGGTAADVLHPASQMLQLQEICRLLVQPLPSGPADFGRALEEAAARTGRRGVVFVFSDLLDEPAALHAGLQRLVFHKHEVIVFQILDAAELDFPFRDSTLFRGLEGQPEVLTDPLAVRDSYLAAMQRHLAAVRDICRQLAIDHLLLRTDAEIGRELAAYLLRRQSVRRGPPGA